ncbi:recombination-associated protein RdgC [Stenotrophomonas maltophilia]|uniref:recombination-associated protein RdgC n=1 Tax=Stenotrophomonas maltophilia TaxID=40324 RepID=UPI0007F8CEEB|nr:recombination-associated protein RdgC [Stenotrophomonas maltophilia]OBU55448.1 recombination-associated protein RdgC [Stenotrophomonas maltophilia]
MFFRNLTMFRFPVATDFSEIATLLPAAVLKPVGALEMNSRGFVSPFGREETEQLFHGIGDWLWLTIGAQDKILPASVVADRLEEKLAAIASGEGRRPGGRERKRLKDDLLHELLPTAMVKSSRLDVFLDTARGVAFVDTSSRKAGEYVMSDIRGLLGSFPAMPLNAEVAPRSILTGWIAGEPLPTGLSLGEECEMKDPVEGGAVVKCQHQELCCDEIDKHLDAGKQVTKLALIFEDSVSFVLGDDMVVRKLRFLDGALDKLDGSDQDGRRAEFDARFALQIGELGRVFDVISDAFRISPAE